MSPSALSSPHSSEITATNTLIVTNLDRPVFLPENFVELKANFEQYGSIHKFIPIKSFNRMLVIYFQTSDAKTAKAYSDRMIFMDKVVRVYYGQHTPVIDETDSFKHLNIPKLEKNWLISPPGSPPFGWTPTHETGPNEKTLADDLTHTLVNICLNNSNSNGVDIIYEDKIEDFSLDNGHNSDDNNNEKSLQFMPPPSTTTTTSKIPILKIISNDLGADDNHRDDDHTYFT
nr:8913_t:CDS:2 [Entrophospora candida]